VLHIDGERAPTRYALDANAFVLARYAAICQQAGIMPIVEPEVLRNGNQSIGTSAAMTRDAEGPIRGRVAEYRSKSRRLAGCNPEA